MENITLGQAFNAIKFIVEFVGILISVIFAVRKTLNKQLEPLNEKIDDVNKTVNKKIDEVKTEIHSKIDTLDMNDCKNFLVRFLADVERGQPIDEVEIKRAHDVYDHYKDDLGGNSYIADKWNKLMK